MAIFNSYVYVRHYQSVAVASFHKTGHEAERDMPQEAQRYRMSDRDLCANPGDLHFSQVAVGKSQTPLAFLSTL